MQAPPPPTRRSYLLSKQLNKFARKYLVSSTTANHDPSLAVTFESAREAALEAVTEALMLHDGVALSVYGENVGLAVLVNLFGVRGVEELLEQGALEFVLENIILTHMRDDVPGVLPLQSGELTSGPHSDPEQSAYEGLRWLKHPLDKYRTRDLARKVARSSKTLPLELASDAVELVYAAHSANLLDQFGIPSSTPLKSLPTNDRELLNSIAQSSLDVATLALNGYDSTESSMVLTLAEAEIARLNQLTFVNESAAHIFRIENLPRIGRLITSGTVPATSVPSLRKTSNAVEFRNWLRRLNTSMDANEVSREYIDSIVGRSGFWTSGHGKLAKVIGITTIGVGLSVATGDPLAGAIGASAALALGAASSFGLNLLDSYVLDRVARGWTPRSFIEEVRGAILK